jgi:hypothetical protein
MRKDGEGGGVKHPRKKAEGEGKENQRMGRHCLSGTGSSDAGAAAEKQSGLPYK